MAVFTEAGVERPGSRGSTPDPVTANRARVAAGPGPASGEALLGHQPGLDGLRGAAVLAVLAYHLGWLPGGFLGVSLFFTLSGFLITNLLLQEADRSGRIRLGAFWARRARRLLPAAVAGVALAVAVTAATGTADQLRALPGDVIGALAYSANWRFVLAHNSYRAGFAAPSALLHYWSLAIEEQLYVVLPLLVGVVALRRKGPPRDGNRRRRLGAVLLALMAVSAAATLVLGPAHADRVYFGTDTRMFELLAGAMLAIVAGFPGAARDRLRRSRWAGPAGAAAGVGVVALWCVSHQSDPWLYRGGLWTVSALSGALIVGACWSPRMGRALTWRPLPAAGRISYGLYVYHWPLFVALDSAHTGLHGITLAAARLAATVATASVSYRWLEQPIRRRRAPIAPVLRSGIPLALAAVVTAALVTSGLATSRSIAGSSHRRLLLAGSIGFPTPVERPVSARPPAPTATGAGAPAAPQEAAPARARGGAPTSVAVALPPLSRVLFMGDSLVQQAFPTFADRLHRQGIDARVIGGNGQSLMTHQNAWLVQLAGAVNSYDPDVVVLESCCGQFRFDPPLTGTDGQVIAPNTPEFQAAWRALALHASQIASTRGALVLWILGPPTHTNGWYGAIDGQVAGINAVYEALTPCPARTGTIDWSVVGGPGGTYAASVPDATGAAVQVRQTDGFHFTSAGIDALSEVTLPAITRAWNEGGRAGPWPAACP